MGNSLDHVNGGEQDQYAEIKGPKSSGGDTWSKIGEQSCRFFFPDIVFYFTGTNHIAYTSFKQVPIAERAIIQMEKLRIPNLRIRNFFFKKSRV